MASIHEIFDDMSLNVSAFLQVASHPCSPRENVNSRKHYEPRAACLLEMTCDTPAPQITPWKALQG